MGTKQFVSKKPDMCSKCVSFRCISENASHWCPILTDRMSKKHKKGDSYVSK